MYNDLHHRKKRKKKPLSPQSCCILDTAFTALTQPNHRQQAITKYSLYRSSDKVGMICKWILPDSSVYYAVTLVSSDAVWLLSHLTVKKGSWVRGMDCAVSALVTQIVRTLQRNKCIFDCSCIEGMWNPFPLREAAKRQMMWLVCVQNPLILCFYVSRSRVKRRACVFRDWTRSQLFHIDKSYAVFFVLYTQQRFSQLRVSKT